MKKPAVLHHIHTKYTLTHSFLVSANKKRISLFIYLFIFNYNKLSNKQDRHYNKHRSSSSSSSSSCFFHELINSFVTLVTSSVITCGKQSLIVFTASAGGAEGKGREGLAFAHFFLFLLFFIYFSFSNYYPYPKLVLFPFPLLPHYFFIIFLPIIFFIFFLLFLLLLYSQKWRE